MNTDLYRYKLRSLTCMLILGYAFMHVMLTGIYEKVTLEQLVTLTSSMPYNQRVLVPLIAHFTHYAMPVDLQFIFFILECIFDILIFYQLVSWFQTFFSPRESYAWSWLFFLLLPLVTIINYRYTLQGEAQIYYVYDMSTVFFMLIGYRACYEKSWTRFFVILIFATLNRESAILLVGLIPLLHFEERNKLYPVMFGGLVIYGAIHYLILQWAHQFSGTLIEWVAHDNIHSHFFMNLFWLFPIQNIFIVVFALAGLPAFWFTFYDYIPRPFQRIKYLLLAYFIGLFFVSNFMEARVFLEIITFMYIPVAIAMNKWLTHQSPSIPPHYTMTVLVDRYIVPASLVMILLLHRPLDELSTKLFQWMFL